MLGNPNDKLATIGAARNADGRLEAFGTAPDNTIWHAWQTTPGGGWSGWPRFSKQADRLVNLATEQSADGRLEAFGTAPDNTIWHASQSSPNTWPPELPDAPQAPSFINVSQTSLIIKRAPLPDFASSLNLEQRQTANSGPYTLRATKLTGDLQPGGLSPRTAYTFRFMAVGQGGSTPGPPATVITSEPPPPQQSPPPHHHPHSGLLSVGVAFGDVSPVGSPSYNCQGAAYININPSLSGKGGNSQGQTKPYEFSGKSGTTEPACNVTLTFPNLTPGIWDIKELTKGITCQRMINAGQETVLIIRVDVNT